MGFLKGNFSKEFSQRISQRSFVIGFLKGVFHRISQMEFPKEISQRELHKGILP
jgi:hypothetical protein